MALQQTAAGQFPSTRQTSGNPNVPGGTFGEQIVTEINPQYYQLAKLGKVFSLSATGVNPSAFTGGAAGTPLIGLWNPQGTATDLVLLYARIGIRTTGSAAGTVDFNHWLVNQGGTAITGTQTQARNVYSGAQSGSIAYGMVNVANTAALSSNLLMPSVSLGAVSATAALTVGALVDEIKGGIIVGPGMYYAYGAAAALTGASLDVSLVWAEIPA